MTELFCLTSVVDKLPVIKKQLFNHKLKQTEEAKAALKRMAVSLKAIRKERNIPQWKLAAMAGVSLATIKMIEGQYNFPSFSLYLALCKALDQPRPPLT